MSVFLYLALLLQGTLQVDAASVEGLVVTEGTSEPIPAVAVSLVPEGKGTNAALKAFTSTAGKFKITGIPSGRYQLTADRPGYVKLKLTGGPTTLRVNAGESLKNIRVELSLTLAITGRILDEKGAPKESAIVTAVRLTYSSGVRVLSPCGAPQNARVKTNDRGEYRAFGLEPGTYYLAVAEASAVVFGANGLPLPEPRCSTLYHPGVVDPSEAVPVVLKPGSDTNGIDIQWKKPEMHTASFKIETPPPRVSAVPPPPPYITVARVSRDGIHTFEYQGSIGTFHSDGTYTTPALPEGSYDLEYGDLAVNAREVGRIHFDIADRDIEAAAMVVHSAVAVTGHVKFESVSQAPDIAGLTLGLYPLDVKAGVLVRGTPVGKDGSFSIGYAPGEAYTPVGRYRFLFFGGSENMYLASAVTAGKDVLDGGLVVDGTTPPRIELTFRMGTRVEGALRDFQDESIPDRSVALIPEENRRGNVSLFKTVATDQEGRFSIPGVAPGNYTILAFEDAEPGAITNPEFIKTIGQRGKVLQIAPGTANLSVSGPISVLSN